MRFPLLLAAILIAGCSSSPPVVDPTPANETLAPATPPDPAPPTPFSDPVLHDVEIDAPCEHPRAAVAHDRNATLGPAPAALCVFRTAHRGTENTIGVCPRTGTVYAGLAIGDGRGAGAVATADEGATWDFLVPTLQGHATHLASLDPYLYLDPTTCRLYLDDLVTPNCSLLSWTDDAATWTHSASGCMEFDHQTIFAGPPRTSPTVGYPNIVYRCAINLVATGGASTAATCQRSLDGGLTWLPPGAPAFLPQLDERGHYNLTGNCDGATGHGLVDPDGRVYLPKGCGKPWIAWSDDEGLTWTRVRVSELGMKMDNSGLVDHDGSIARDAAGTLYYGWLAADRLPHLAYSTDRGQSWKDVGAIAPPGLQDAALASLDVTPDGVVALSYFGSYDAELAVPLPACEEAPQECATRFVTPQDVGNNGTWFGHVSFVRGATTGAPAVWSATTGDEPLIRGPCGVRCQDAYDFQDVAFAPDGAAWATFVDGEAEGELIVVRFG